MARIEVISSCLVGMASINEAPMSRLELTPFDLKTLLLVPSQKGLLFRKPDSQHLQETLIDHLKDSLSRTLGFFPPLAGRLGTIQNDDDTTSFFVDCNNAGVEFTHAVADAVSISDILEPIYIPDQIVFSLFPLNGIRNVDGISKPLFGVQVTDLADGLFVGWTTNHVVADGTSIWHFINSWSEIARGFDSISKSPVFERWFPSSIANENRLIRLPPLLEPNPLQNVSVPAPLLGRVFHFSKESVAKLKAKANSEAGTDNISSLQALSAHLWRSYTRARRSHSSRSSEEEAPFVIVVGARARIPLPDGYFGNAVHGGGIAISEKVLLQNGLGYAALKINELIARQTSEAIIKFVEDWVKTPILRGTVDIFFNITNSPRFNMYGNDFGWGKPIAMRSGQVQKREGKISLSPAAVAGGINVEIWSELETFQAMEDDAEFMEAFTI